MTTNTVVNPVLRLKGLRAERQLTQGDIADKLCISKATYNRKENGLGQFCASEIAQLLDIFEVGYDDIFSMKSSHISNLGGRSATL